jgi:hypothetical protein
MALQPARGQASDRVRLTSALACFAGMHEQAMTGVLAAAVTEVNRDLSAVTDGEERRVLEGLISITEHNSRPPPGRGHRPPADALQQSWLFSAHER